MIQPPSTGESAGPTMLDRAFQLAYTCAYQLMRAYWRLRRPTTHGSLVTMWHRGELLLVRNSYVSYYSVPGGYLRAGETGVDAAVRELREEVGVEARPDQLRLLLEETHLWEGKNDHVLIFALEVTERPPLRVDHREVTEATWQSPERALRQNLFPPLRRAIEQRLSRG